MQIQNETSRLNFSPRQSQNEQSYSQNEQHRLSVLPNQSLSSTSITPSRGMISSAMKTALTVRQNRCQHDDDDSCNASPPSRVKGFIIAGVSLAAMLGMVYLKASADDGVYEQEPV